MIDISRGDLYIKSLFSVQRGSIRARKKPTPTSGRHSDALVYIISGDCRYSFSDGSSFHALEGDIIYLADGAHYSMAVGDGTYSFIYCDFFFDSDEVRACGRYPAINASETENLFRKLCSAYGSHDADARLKCMSILYEIYASLCRSVATSSTLPACTEKILEAAEYIDSAYTDPSISVSSLAHRAGMSEVYFRKLFRQVKLMSPSQYIGSLRIKNAKRLLRLGFMSTEECALQSGFSSVQYFSRAFKKSTGQTPSEYKEHR